MPSNAQSPVPLLLCLSCGYSLAGVACSGEGEFDVWKCPECGCVTHRADLHRIPEAIRRSRPALWPATLTGVFAAFASPAILGRGWPSHLVDFGLWALIIWNIADVLVCGVRALSRLPRVLRWRVPVIMLESLTLHLAGAVVGLVVGMLLRAIA